MAEIEHTAVLGELDPGIIDKQVSGVGANSTAADNALDAEHRHAMESAQRNELIVAMLQATRPLR